jgi:hypothetical protein
MVNWVYWRYNNKEKDPSFSNLVFSPPLNLLRQLAERLLEN